MEEKMICDCIREILPNCEDRVLRPETRLSRDLGADSLEVLQIVSRVGECFQISVPLETLEDALTVGDLYQAVGTVREEGEGDADE